MDTIEAIRSRRSIRSFSNRDVPRHLIEDIVIDASAAPYTPLSRDDPFVFYIIEGAERVAALGSQALAYAREHRPQLAGYEWTERADFSVFHGAPAAMILCSNEAGLLSAEECIRAGQLITLSAHARGLGCCWVGSPLLWLRSDQGRDALGMGDGLVVREAFAIGYAAATPPPSVPRAGPLLNWR